MYITNNCLLMRQHFDVKRNILSITTSYNGSILLIYCATEGWQNMLQHALCFSDTSLECVHPLLLFDGCGTSFHKFQPVQRVTGSITKLRSCLRSWMKALICCFKRREVRWILLGSNIVGGGRSAMSSIRYKICFYYLIVRVHISDLKWGNLFT